MSTKEEPEIVEVYTLNRFIIVGTARVPARNRASM